jgi:sulfur-oxidizing protein SoxY
MTSTHPEETPMRHKQMGRREGMALAAGLIGLSLVGRSAAASMEGPTRAAVDRVLAGRTPREAGVTLRLPAIAENGNTVPMTVVVDSPMTEAQHVRAIALFNERNPQPDVAVFHLSPQSGRARVVTRIRLGDTQQVVAVAQMSDGSFRSGSAKVIVTLPACVETS